ncbi:hypothetical protein EUGRSUZ_H01798 [Eucalyptus grandis]|uniref:Uncharacterized protein n=3 Tax=Eucalyptus grandis TaxID=71139 RepID=A0A059AYV4_EUCGR|nr:hypothetical protein EUGRSUZ_H01798 [Eucalyptus grandis]KAK3416326.1 hypothetical protein EUGRSUZ_H01798 [Eucalyptus grandis]
MASSSRPPCSRIALCPDAGLSPTRAALSPLWSKPSLPRSPRSATTIPASLRTGPTRSLVGTGSAIDMMTSTITVGSQTNCCS